jgi:hypothetical protein
MAGDFVNERRWLALDKADPLAAEAAPGCAGPVRPAQPMM